MADETVLLKRNLTIDILRCIGLFLVIAAHCEFPEWFFEFREFDVVLLVFVSGASFFSSSSLRKGTYKDYVVHRFRKLILPVWEFLVLFFLFFFLLGRRFSLPVIAESFLLLSGGILFIWVYRVFFTTSLLNPFMKALVEKQKTAVVMCLPVIALIINDLLGAFAHRIFPPMAFKVFQYVITYTVSYAAISLAGITWMKLSEKERIHYSIMWIGLFIVCGSLLKFPGFYEWKYPPTLYYSSYGLVFSSVLYLLFDRVPLSQTIGSLIEWISRKTMTIYLWHVFLYYLIESAVPHVLNNAFLSLALLLGGGILGTLVQDMVMKKVRGRHVQ